jgi:hypothetical protein
MKPNDPKGNYPPGMSDKDIDRAWGEEQEFLSSQEIEHEIDRIMELEGLRRIDECEAYGFSEDEFDDDDP